MVNRIEVARDEWSILTVETFRDECMAKSVNSKRRYYDALLLSGAFCPVRVP